MPVSAQNPDQPIVVESIPSHSGSDLVSIKALEDESTSPTNPPLTSALGLEVFWPHPNYYTPTYTHIPL